MPGHAEEARRLKEIVALYLPIPDRPNLPGDCAALVDRLAYVGKSDRAAAVLKEGLAKTPESETLWARKAMLLALAGKYDESMEAQKKCGYLQVDWRMSYQGLGDCLLSKGRPDLAIQSFGGSEPKKFEHRRILAWACAETKDFARAENLLREIDVKGLTLDERVQYGTQDVRDQLLTVRVLLSARQEKRARDLGAKIIESLNSARLRFGRDHLPSGPPSLKDEYVRAVQWLAEQFPEQKDLIKSELAVVDIRSFIGPLYTFDPVPASVLIPQLRERLRNPPSVEDATKLRRNLARACEEAGRFSEAAEVIAPEAIVPPRFSPYLRPRLNYAAVLWNISVRRADTESLHQKDPRVLVTARRLLANIRGKRWNYPKVAGRDWLSEQEVVDRLAALGPGVLSCVIDDLGPNTISGADRSPFVEVIKRLGGPEDTPVLIDTLSLVTLSDGRTQKDARSAAGDLASQRAILECLEKFTNEKTPDGSPEARVKFWFDWWSENAAKIVASRSKLE